MESLLEGHPYKVLLVSLAPSGAHASGTVRAVALCSFSAPLDAIWLLLILETTSRDSILSEVNAGG